MGAIIGGVLTILVWNIPLLTDWIMISWFVSGLVIFLTASTVLRGRGWPRIVWFVSGLFAAPVALYFLVWWIAIKEPWKFVWSFFFKEV
jgi:hypothetical protein